MFSAERKTKRKEEGEEKKGERNGRGRRKEGSGEGEIWVFTPQSASQDVQVSFRVS